MRLGRFNSLLACVSIRLCDCCAEEKFGYYTLYVLIKIVKKASTLNCGNILRNHSFLYIECGIDAQGYSCFRMQNLTFTLKVCKSYNSGQVTHCDTNAHPHIPYPAPRAEKITI